MAEWSDSTTFAYETARTIALAIIGGFVAYWILDPQERELAYSAEIDKAKLTIATSVVDEFLAAAYQYTSIAYDACLGKQPERTEYGGKTYDEYRATINRLSVYLDSKSSLEPHFDTVKAANDAFRDVCDQSNNETEWEPLRTKLKDTHNELAKHALAAIWMTKKNASN